jgi:hypothetical protein
MGEQKRQCHSLLHSFLLCRCPHFPNNKLQRLFINLIKLILIASLLPKVSCVDGIIRETITTTTTSSSRISGYLYLQQPYIAAAAGIIKQNTSTSSSSSHNALLTYSQDGPGFWSFITLMFCGVISLMTVIGNICVIAAVHQVLVRVHYLIFS